MIARAKNSAINMWADDSTKLSTGIRQANANSSSYRTIECSDAFWPYDWVRGSGTRSRDNKTKILDRCIWDGDEEDVADNDGGFNFRELVGSKREVKRGTNSQWLLSKV